MEADPADAVDREIHEMQRGIAEAAEAMEKLMLEAKQAEMEGKNRPNLDVDLKIIDSCSQLLASVQVNKQNQIKISKIIPTECQ